MARTIKRTNPGDAANIFVRCILSDISDMLGGCSQEDIDKTVKYFDYKCPYTGEDITEVYLSGTWVLDHLIPHNRESAGLNLYGNLVVTTKATNAAKAAKNFEDFIKNDTNGSDIEKNARIQKLYKFQEESGYLNKINNIDKIKELCQEEYNFILNRLNDDKIKYDAIINTKKKMSSEEQLLYELMKKYNIKPGKNSITSPLSLTTHINKMTKQNAISLLRSSGIDIFGQITFSSQNSGTYVYWANPNIRYIQNDWWLILNDIDNRILHALFIPANSIRPYDIVVRADKPELIDLQINYFNDTFIDNRSKIDFSEWVVKSINY